MVLEAIAIKAFSMALAWAAGDGGGRPIDLHRAVSATSEQFRAVPGVEPSLEKWIASAGFAELPKRLSSGEREFSLDDLVGAFIEDGDFYLPEERETQGLAKEVVEAFLGAVVSEFYSSDQGLVALANRQEELHLETGSDIKTHVTAEVNALRTDLLASAPQAPVPDHLGSSEPATEPEHLQLMTQLDGVRDLINTGLIRAARAKLDELPEGSDLPDGLAFRITTYLGVCALAEEDYESACELFDDAHLLQRDEPQGIANQAVAAGLRKDHKRAEKLARKALEMDPNNSRAAAVLIHALWELEKCDQLEQLVTTESWIIEDDQAGLAVAQIRVSQSRAMEAISICERLAVKDPDDFHTALLLGQTLLNEAQAIFSQSGGSDPESHAMLVRAEAQADRAIRLLKDTQRDSLKADARALRALVLGALRRIDEAAREAERALEHKPQHPAAMLCHGLALFHAGRPREAVEAWKDLNLEDAPDDFEVFVAEAHLEAGNAAAACDLLGGTVDFEHPGPLFLDRIEILARAESIDESPNDVWRDLDSELSKRPEDPYLLAASALQSRANGDVECAMQSLQRALDRVQKVDRWPFLLRLAEVLMSEQRYFEAADTFAEFVNDDPYHPLAERLLVCLFNAKRLREAIDWCRRMRGALPDCPKSVIDAEAQIVELAGDLTEARSLRKQICERADVTDYDRFRLAFVYFRGGDQNAARETVRRIDPAKLREDPRALLRVAQLKMLLGEEGYLEDAYKAWQYGRHDPDVQMGYFSLILTEDRDSTDPEVVVPGCYVLLRNQSAESWWYVLEAGEEARTDYDLTLDAPLALKLEGRSVGDEILLRDIGYEIVAIQDKFKRAIQQTAQLFPTRFPDNEGLSSIEIEEDDPAPLFNLVSQRSRFVQNAADAYRSHQLFPFSSFCNLVGASELEVWRASIYGQGMPIRFSSGDSGEAEGMADLLAQVDGIILDAVALLTIHELGIADKLRQRFSQIAVPQNVLDVIREDIASAEQDRSEGVFGQDLDGRYYFHEHSDESRRERQGFARSVLACAESFEVGACYGLLDVPNDDVTQQFLTHAGIGALLADRKRDGVGLVLMCDDLALAVLSRVVGGSAVNSQAVLGELRRSGVISSDEYAEHIESLAAINYTFVQVSADDLVRRLRANGYITTDGTRAMLRTLRGPDCADDAAVGVATAVVVKVAQSLSAPSLAVFVALVMSVLRDGRELTDIWSQFRSALAGDSTLTLIPIIRSAVLGIVDDQIAAERAQLAP